MDAPDPFSRLLNRWQPPAVNPGAIRQEVWRRVSRDEASLPNPTWSEQVQAWFTQPAFAVAFVTCCLLIGLFLAEVRVSHAQHSRELALARAYVLAIDPLAAEESRP